MVSELSARLLKGYNITYTTASASGGKRMSDFSSNSSCSSSSTSNGENDSRSKTVDRSLRGTSGAEGRISSRSSIIKSMNNDDTERLSNRDACFKRRKIDELRFAASQVKEDLEKGGLPFPSIHAKKPRALEGFDINMSNIRLLDAKSVSDSPFLTPQISTGGSGGKGNNNSSNNSKNCRLPSFQNNFYDVGQLFNETQKAYSKRWIQGDINSRNSDWEKSSAGSLTSDSESSCVVDIPPLLEDSLKYKFSEINTQPLASIKTVSMGSALENTNEARLVTLSFAPFLIIHVNAAYTRMTGLGAKDVLGKPLRDIFKDKRCKAMASSVSSLASMHEQLTSVSTVRQDKRCNCSLQVSLVGPTDCGADDAEEGSCSSSTGSKRDSNKAANATHCMVAVHPTDQENANFGSQPIVTSVPNLKNPLPCGVIG